MTPTKKLQMSIHGCGLQSSCSWLQTCRTINQYYKRKVIAQYLKPQLRIWWKVCRVPEPQPDISGYQKLCREFRLYLKISHLFRSNWNSARNFPVPVLQLSILGTCNWTKYFTVSGIQPEIITVPEPQPSILCIWTWTTYFAVTETQPRVSRYLDLSYLFLELKLSHLFSGTWTSVRYLTPC